MIPAKFDSGFTKVTFLYSAGWPAKGLVLGTFHAHFLFRAKTALGRGLGNALCRSTIMSFQFWAVNKGTGTFFCPGPSATAYFEEEDSSGQSSKTTH